MNKFVKKLAFFTACIASLNAVAEDKIVSIGGDVTEIIYALNQQAKLVGRDSTSILPVEAKTLPDVGYMRQLNAEGILALKPNRVITNSAAQPAAVFEQLKSAGVQVETVPFEPTAENVLTKIDLLGKLLNQPEQAVKIRQQFTDERKAIPNSPLDVRVLFILNRAGGNNTAAGKNTVADSLIQEIGAINAMGDAARFTPISQEGLIAAKPDLLVITESQADNLEQLWQTAGMALTPAGKHKQVVVVNQLAIMAYGLTTPKEVQKIRLAAEKVAKLKAAAK